MTVMASSSSSLFLSSFGFSSSIPISCSIRSPLIQSIRQHPVVLNLKKNLGFKGLACFCTPPSSESSVSANMPSLMKVQEEVSAVQQVTDAFFEKEEVDGEGEVSESAVQQVTNAVFEKEEVDGEGEVSESVVAAKDVFEKTEVGESDDVEEDSDDEDSSEDSDDSDDEKKKKKKVVDVMYCTDDEEEDLTWCTDDEEEDLEEDLTW